MEARKTRSHPNPFRITHSHTPKIPTTRFDQFPTNWMSRKERKIDNGIYFLLIKKAYLLHLRWPFGVLVETQVYTGCQSFFTHVLLIIRTPPFDSRKISSSLAMTLSCIGWNTDKEEDAVQYRLWMLDYFFSRSVLGEWSLCRERAEACVRPHADVRDEMLVHIHLCWRNLFDASECLFHHQKRSRTSLIQFQASNMKKRRKVQIQKMKLIKKILALSV